MKYFLLAGSFLFSSSSFGACFNVEQFFKDHLSQKSWMRVFIRDLQADSPLKKGVSKEKVLHEFFKTGTLEDLYEAPRPVAEEDIVRQNEDKDLIESTLGRSQEKSYGKEETKMKITKCEEKQIDFIFLEKGTEFPTENSSYTLQSPISGVILSLTSQRISFTLKGFPLINEINGKAVLVASFTKEYVVEFAKSEADFRRSVPFAASFLSSINELFKTF